MWMIEHKKIKVEELVTHRFGLKDLGKAVDTALSAADSLKVMVDCRA